MCAEKTNRLSFSRIKGKTWTPVSFFFYFFFIRDRLRLTMNKNTRTTTIWDLHWHPSVRSVVRAFCREPFYDALYEALEAAKCTTVDKLKHLTAESPCLAAMTELTCTNLLEAAARLTDGKRIALIL
jgi:hypothetical protein